MSTAHRISHYDRIDLDSLMGEVERALDSLEDGVFDLDRGEGSVVYYAVAEDMIPALARKGVNADDLMALEDRLADSFRPSW